MLLWAYMANTTAFILHEMDAVYWKEWELFGITRDYPGLMVFILVHAVLWPVLFYGMVNLKKRAGLAISLIMGLFGMGHWFLHALIGRGYFITDFSMAIINAIFVISAPQLYLTVKEAKGRSVTA
jgi:surface polysaccharide O-acyltransferase-like enzyme